MNEITTTTTTETIKGERKQIVRNSSQPHVLICDEMTVKQTFIRRLHCITNYVDLFLMNISIYLPLSKNVLSSDFPIDFILF